MSGRKVSGIAFTVSRAGPRPTNAGVVTRKWQQQCSLASPKPLDSRTYHVPLGSRHLDRRHHYFLDSVRKSHSLYGIKRASGVAQTLRRRPLMISALLNCCSLFLVSSDLDRGPFRRRNDRIQGDSLAPCHRVHVHHRGWRFGQRFKVARVAVLRRAATRTPCSGTARPPASSISTRPGFCSRPLTPSTATLRWGPDP